MNLSISSNVRSEWVDEALHRRDLKQLLEQAILQAKSGG